MSVLKPTILIVDDDEDVPIHLEHVLETEGYRTATAWGGKEALSLSEETKFDLMLIDEHISDLDLNWLVRELQRKQPGAMRLVMSGRRANSSTTAKGVQPTVCKWEHSAVAGAGPESPRSYRFRVNNLDWIQLLPKKLFDSGENFVFGHSGGI